MLDTPTRAIAIGTRGVRCTTGNHGYRHGYLRASPSVLMDPHGVNHECTGVVMDIDGVAPWVVMGIITSTHGASWDPMGFPGVAPWIPMGTMGMHTFVMIPDKEKTKRLEVFQPTLTHYCTQQPATYEYNAAKKSCSRRQASMMKETRARPRHARARHEARDIL